MWGLSHTEWQHGARLLPCSTYSGFCRQPTRHHITVPSLGTVILTMCKCGLYLRYVMSYISYIRCNVDPLD